MANTLLTNSVPGFAVPVPGQARAAITQSVDTPLIARAPRNKGYAVVIALVVTLTVVVVAGLIALFFLRCRSS